MTEEVKPKRTYTRRATTATPPAEPPKVDAEKEPPQGDLTDKTADEPNQSNSEQFVPSENQKPLEPGIDEVGITTVSEKEPPVKSLAVGLQIHVKNNGSKSVFEPATRTTIPPFGEVIIDCIGNLQLRTALSNFKQLNALGHKLEVSHE